jgi:hypothetical protein
VSNGRSFTIICSCGAVKRVPALRRGTITLVTLQHELNCSAVAKSKDRLVNERKRHAETN